MRIGDYLIQQGLITDADLRQALDTQAKQRIPMGLLARQNSMMENKDIFLVLKAQKGVKDRSRDFAKIASETGVLTEEKATKLRNIQNANRELLGKILLTQGAVARDQLIKALRGFQSLGKN